MAVLNVLSCLVMFWLPATSLKESVRFLNTLLNVLIFSTTLMAGIGTLAASPREVFILARGSDSLLLYPVRTYSSYSWNISQSWTFNQSSHSLQNQETDQTFNLHFGVRVYSQLCLTRNISQSDIEALSHREIFIAEQINPINWEMPPFG